MTTLRLLSAGEMRRPEIRLRPQATAYKTRTIRS